ncbi:hypothetical protein scyTo_0026869, partial [Scyliorhinus torazame]|nr:hypothetical protein [Scyliorhinus torazame]
MLTDIPILVVSLTPDYHLPRVQELQETFKVFIIDDPSIVRALLRVFAVECVQALPDSRDQLVLHLPGAEDVIRGHTGLARVEEAAPGQAVGCTLQVKALVNVTRVLAPQFQRDRCQVFRCSFHNDLAN